MKTQLLRRSRRINQHDDISQTVVYWMSRDQRLNDNWALLFAQQKAIEIKVPLTILFVLTNSIPNAQARHYDFMLRGLAEVAESAHQHNISFRMLQHDKLTGDSVADTVITYLAEEKVGCVVADFSPMRFGRDWRNSVASRTTVSFYEVDAHNCIPAWVVSDKQEFGAYTIRPKVHKHLAEFLDNSPEVQIHPYGSATIDSLDIPRLIAHIAPHSIVGPLNWIIPGEKKANIALQNFIENKLDSYAASRNDPNLSGQSDLSPYLHFGHISAQRVVQEIVLWSVKEHKKDLDQLLLKDKNGSSLESGSAEAFIEELVVRRELSDNYCLYNPHYDSIDGFPEWAKKSHAKHKSDPREFIYTFEELNLAKTHDELWNAAQREMVVRGKMHGYMRMYWAKKILEWTKSVHDAMKIAIALNDMYQLDGRDPNGYAGIAWSLGGVHDRAWFERPVFGQIRYMNYNGCKGKFDVDAYIKYCMNL